jgi:hypothetical protein
MDDIQRKGAFELLFAVSGYALKLRIDKAESPILQDVNPDGGIEKELRYKIFFQAVPFFQQFFGQALGIVCGNHGIPLGLNVSFASGKSDLFLDRSAQKDVLPD